MIFNLISPTTLTSNSNSNPNHSIYLITIPPKTLSNDKTHDPTPADARPYREVTGYEAPVGGLLEPQLWLLAQLARRRSADRVAAGSRFAPVA